MPEHSYAYTDHSEGKIIVVSRYSPPLCNDGDPESAEAILPRHNVSCYIIDITLPYQQ